MGQMRLDKFLSNMGLGSRKDVKQLIKNKLVEVDGILITNSDYVIDTDQTIKCKGKEINFKKNVYLMLNKPKGYISATEDTKDKTVMELIDHPRKSQLHIVGRLDKDTEGLLLLTDDGDFTHNALTPKKHVEKKYFATVNGIVNNQDIEHFKKGVTIDNGYDCLPGELEVIEVNNDTSDIHLTITEGKFHQVKRMFEAIGKEVIYLKRVRFGKLELPNDLEFGDYIEIEKGDIIND